MMDICRYLLYGLGFRLILTIIKESQYWKFIQMLFEKTYTRSPIREKTSRVGDGGSNAVGKP